VKIQGSLRGVVVSGLARVGDWKPVKPRLWSIQPKESTTELTAELLEKRMQEKYKDYFKNLQFGV
jgi:hypothetical protein